MTISHDESLCVEVLGPLRAWVDGYEVRLGPPMQGAAIAVLAMRANEVVTGAEIIDSLWGQDPPASAHGSLHTYIAGLRRALEPGRAARTPPRFLVTEGAGYVLRVDRRKLDFSMLDHYREQAVRSRAAGDLDAAQGSLDAALGLWRGTTLAGVPGPFADLVRTKLSEVRLALLEDRAEVMLELGEHGRVAVELSALVREHPLRERLVAQLMLAQYRAGRQSDALTTYYETRRVLRAELGIEPSGPVRELHEQILANDTSLDAPQSGRLAVSAHDQSLVPAQLPHTVRNFTGRHAELTALRGLLGRGAAGPAIVAINGPAGVGKTALAVHFAREIAAGYPDGQLYLNLRGFDPVQSALSVQESLGQLLRGLGLDPKRISGSPDEQAATFRAVLARKRVIVLLDNAVSARQVLPLLPDAPGCLVVVTSRNRLEELVTPYPVHRVPLDVLTSEDSVTLLAHVCGDERVAEEQAAARRLAKLCGYLPLALRVAAERVTGHSHLRLSDLVEDLTAERDRLDVLDSGDDEASTVRAVFSWSYHALKPEPRRVFRMLGLHPSTEFDEGVAAATLSISATVARRLLASLAADHLLESTGAGRFRFHDLIRVYAGECAVEEETAEARLDGVRRMLAWYLHSAAAAGAVLGPQRRALRLGAPPDNCVPRAFGAHQDAVAWCETERTNLLGAARFAAEMGEHETAWHLSYVLWGFFHLRSHWPDWVSIAEVGLRSARVLDDPAAQAQALNDLATAQNYVGRSSEAKDNLEEALRLHRTLDLPVDEARTLNNLGVVCTRQGGPDEAIGHLKSAMRVLRAHGDDLALSNALCNLGVAEAILGEHDVAIAHLLAGLEICRAHGHLWGLSYTLNCLGDAYRRVGMFSEAEVTYRESVVLCRRTGDRFGEATALESLGHVSADRGDIRASRGHWIEALVALDDVGHPHADELRAQLGGTPPP